MQWILNHVMAGELGDSLSKWSFKTTCYNAFSQSSYDSRPWSIKYWGYKAFLNALFRYLDNITNKLGLFFDGPPSCKSCSSRTSVVVAQLLSAPRGSPWWRSHHIQLCSGLKPKAVSPCLLWGRPAAALVVKSCLKQMVILQGEPAFFSLPLPATSPSPRLLLLFNLSKPFQQNRLTCCVANPSSAVSCSWLTTFPPFGGLALQPWQWEAAATLK